MSNEKAAAPRPPTNLRHAQPPKRRGELSELAFMHKVVSLGFSVTKPWGDSDRCDFILDTGDRLWRVQVRSTEYLSHRGYSVHTYVYVKHQMVALTEREIDVVIAYIVPLNLWYVVPVKDFAGRKNLWFYPHGSKKGSRFEIYREAWHLIAPKLKPCGAGAPPADVEVDVDCDVDFGVASVGTSTPVRRCR